MERESLIRALTLTAAPKREAALRDLGPPETLLGAVADILLQEGDPDLRANGFDYFERCGAEVLMMNHHTDGWFEKLKVHIPQFDALKRVLGERFLAYAFILGIQIRALNVDPKSPLNTAIHFTLNDDEEQVLSLGDFRLQVVQALLHEHRPAYVPRLPFETEAAIGLLGAKNLLVAPLFDISLDRIFLASLDPASPRYLVVYRTPDDLEVVSLDVFLETIRVNLRRDLAGMAERSFSLDLMAVEKARNAAVEGNSHKVVSVLSSWPGLLTMLPKTPVGSQLNPEQLSLIGEGIALLGEALEKLETGTWSEELYKLGLMLVREGPSAGRLLRNLGRQMNLKGEYGVAIGLLKRALALGQPEAEVMRDLGHAFLKQGKVGGRRRAPRGGGRPGGDRRRPRRRSARGPGAPARGRGGVGGAPPEGR